MLFDEREDDLSCLTNSGRPVAFQPTGAYSGGKCLALTGEGIALSAWRPPFGHAVPNWDFEIAENPEPGQYRYLQFAWKAASDRTTGMSLLLGRAWPGGGVAVVAGKYAWKEGVIATRQASDRPPAEWQVVRVDLWALDKAALPGPGHRLGGRRRWPLRPDPSRPFPVRTGPGRGPGEACGRRWELGYARSPRPGIRKRGDPQCSRALRLLAVLFNPAGRHQGLVLVPESCLAGARGLAGRSTASRNTDNSENGYAESFNSKVRDELLNTEEFGSLLEAKVLAKEWRRKYNHVRPHSSLGYRTPAEYGAMFPRPPPLRYAVPRTHP